jgi:GNAT superfamily N-acetyltransferase
MLNASNYLATETLPNGLRLLIRATEPHDDLAGAIQRKVSPTSFFYRFLRPKRYLTRQRNRVVHELRFCQSGRPDRTCSDIISEWRLSPGARYWISRPDEAEIAFIVADAYQKQGVGTAILKHLCSIARQAGLKRLYALAIADNEGAPRLLNKLGFPCDIQSDPAQRMMHVTVHLTSVASTESRTAQEGTVGDDGAVIAKQ